jgi:hypothetical protein
MDVFISYRRSDTQDFVGRVADRLRAARGIGEVFVDVDAIAPGEDFQRRTREVMARCGVSLIVIGPHWRSERDGAPPRIFDESDLVRGEVREALTIEARVIPVLVNDAAMPGSSELPEDIRGLIALNALLVRHTAFERDMEHLIDAVLGRRRSRHDSAFPKRHPSLDFALRSFLGAAAALLALVLVMAVVNAATSHSLADLTGSDGASILAILIVAVLGAAAALVPRLRRARR